MAALEKKVLGARGEDLAASFLKKNGYRILDRNYRCALGEIDIVARDGDVLVFVEVKTKSSRNFAPPQLSVTGLKKKRMVRLSSEYLSKKGLREVDCRFDVVAITEAGGGGRHSIELIRDAFRIDGPPWGNPQRL